MMRSKRILITGAAGALGRELCAADPDTEHGGKYFSPARLSRHPHEKLDVTDVAALQETIESIQPSLIIHLASLPPLGPGRASTHSWQVNAAAVHGVGKLCAHYGIPLIFISSADVFGIDGTRRSAYHELDTPGPANHFGLHKICAETAITQLGSGAFSDAWKAGFRYWILRTSNLFSALEPHHGLIQFMRQKLAMVSEKPVALADDVRTSWTYIPHLAKCVAWLADNQGKVACGTYHVVNRGAASHYEVGWKLGTYFDKANAFSAGPRTEFCQQHGFEACQFPRNNVLETDVWEEACGEKMPTWEAALREYAGLVAKDSLSRAVAA